MLPAAVNQGLLPCVALKYDPMKSGAVVSILIVKVVLLLFPTLSVTVATTVCVPSPVMANGLT